MQFTSIDRTDHKKIKHATIYSFLQMLDAITNLVHLSGGDAEELFKEHLKRLQESKGQAEKDQLPTGKGIISEQ